MKKLHLIIITVCIGFINLQYGCVFAIVKNNNIKLKPYNAQTLIRKKDIGESNKINYPIIDSMELKLFKKVFINEALNKRIQRLEIVVFNHTYSDELSQRTERLKALVLGKDSISANNTDDRQEPELTQENLNELLDKMEQETFQTTYKNESVESRINRLENQFFNEASPEENTDYRIERLSSIVEAKESEGVYKDASTLNHYQNINVGLTATAILLLLIKGLIF